jgi:hypothetical protein
MKDSEYTFVNLGWLIWKILTKYAFMKVDFVKYGRYWICTSREYRLSDWLSGLQLLSHNIRPLFCFDISDLLVN